MNIKKKNQKVPFSLENGGGTRYITEQRETNIQECKKREV